MSETGNPPRHKDKKNLINDVHVNCFFCKYSDFFQKPSTLHHYFPHFWPLFVRNTLIITVNKRSRHDFLLDSESDFVGCLAEGDIVVRKRITRILRMLILCSYVIMSKNVLVSKLKIRKIRKIRVQFLFMQISLISQKKGYEFFRFFVLKQWVLGAFSKTYGFRLQYLWF